MICKSWNSWFQDDEDEDPDGDDDDGSGEWNIRESQICWLDQPFENILKMRFIDSKNLFFDWKLFNIFVTTFDANIDLA